MQGTTGTDTRVLIGLLKAVELAQVAGTPLDVPGVSAALAISTDEAEDGLEQLAAFGLVLLAEELDTVPILLAAGRQFLKREGAVRYWDLRFLPRTIDDLHARHALRWAGTAVIEEFRLQLLGGHRARYAADELVPPAFAAAVDERLALDLFAAGVSLLARLSSGEPAGCVAEEIMGVAMINAAQLYIEERESAGELTGAEAFAAAEALDGLFELFQDADVLRLFEMDEPADAALAQEDPVVRRLGVADQRVESWFLPFGWTVPIGHLFDGQDPEEQRPA